MLTRRNAVAALLAVLLLATAAPADRKGRVLEKITTCVTINERGRPIVGGNDELWILPLPKGEGALLSVRVPAPKEGEPRRLYLAYPRKREEGTEVRLVAEAGPDCVWTWGQISAGKTRFEAIREVECFSVKEGRLKDYDLSEGLFGRLVLVPDGTPEAKAGYVGRETRYDNLDDGK